MATCSLATCSNPGCDQPGTNKCSACKSTPYCGTICQTANWAFHKEECPGYLRKIGMTNLEKAKKFYDQNNFPQTIRYADLAATKLKQLKDRPVEDLSEALRCKCWAMNMTGQFKDSLECAKEWYCLWLTKHTHPIAIDAGFAVIEGCMQNEEYSDAVLYACTTWETLTLSRDSHIPDDKLQSYIAQGAKLLAKSTLALAESGGMPAEEKQAAGVETITLARRALEMSTQLCEPESSQVAESMTVLSRALDFFNDVDDDEVPRLYEQAKAIYARVHGSLSPNVAICEKNLGATYAQRATRASAADDLDLCIANLELALPRIREAVRIYRAINRMDEADLTARGAVQIEENLRIVTARREMLG